MSQTGLYLVATPIGNLEDISYRAVRILSEANVIAAEDTRHSRVLLSHYNISTPVLALHEHNEERMEDRILKRVADGEMVAIISDAGTPLISDPGFKLVRAARKAGLPVYSIPGASAVTAALSVAGLPTDRFIFEGFLPSKAVARKRKLEELSREPRTLVFFESSHRISTAINDMALVFGGDRVVAICRELTKKFETVLRAPLENLQQSLADDANQTRGEFVIVVTGFESSDSESLSSALKMATALLEYMPGSQAARIAAKLNDVPRRDIYRLLEE